MEHDAEIQRVSIYQLAGLAQNEHTHVAITQIKKWNTCIRHLAKSHTLELAIFSYIVSAVANLVN